MCVRTLKVRAVQIITYTTVEKKFEILSFLHQFTGSIVAHNVVDREAEMCTQKKSKINLVLLKNE